VKVDVERELGLTLLGIDSLDAMTLDPGRARFRDPRVSAWSVVEHLQHTALVAASIATAVRSLLKGRGEEGEEVKPVAAEILGAGSIPRGEGQAPDTLRPEDDVSIETVRAAVRKARARWEGLLPRGEEIDECPRKLPHHHLGPLTAAHWVRFAAVHSDHHLRIVGDILGDR
jgi:DinB family protein